MVMAHFGISFVKESDLYECCQTSQIGTHADDVVACARYHGLNATHFRQCQVSDLQSWLAEGLYPIALINTYPLIARWCNHAVVVTTVGDEAIEYLDPARERQQSSVVSFLQAWQMNGNRVILVTLP
jgi:ABC-type bacteriocin/lantibiotic exporter with double-glycine peptidase domain